MKVMFFECNVQNLQTMGLFKTMMTAGLKTSRFFRSSVVTNFDDSNFIEKKAKEILLPGNSFCLGVTEQVFKLPRNVLAICVGKSTYARAGIIVNVTPIEPEFHGTITIEISNTSSSVCKIYAHEGIAQFLFIKGNDEPEISYKDRGGVYQGQRGVVGPRILSKK